MNNDKRNGEQESADELREHLNKAQLMTLGEMELLGWSLKFVRRPLFQDPVPVVVSDSNDEIGLLDPDGKIIIENIENNSQIRTEGDESAVPADTAASEPAAADTEDEATPAPAAQENWVEKRQGDAPVPEDLEAYLNTDQLNALRQIENFGWQLKFVRRPLFQNPVAVIINTDGDRLGTLEADGRIELQGNFEQRTESAETDDAKATPVEQDSKKQVI